MNYGGGQQRRIPDGQFTQTLYSLIKDHKFAEAVGHLQIELQVRVLGLADLLTDLLSFVYT